MVTKIFYFLGFTKLQELMPIKTNVKAYWTHLY